MALEITPTHHDEASNLPLHALRWSAILAGLVVGVAGNLVMVLLGAAVGLAAFSASVGDAVDSGVPIAAAVWESICMVVAAFAGGYVAARSAGLRRTADGVLHGLVAWGVTLLLAIFFIALSADNGIGRLFSASSPVAPSASMEITGLLDEADRQEAIAIMRSRLGLTSEQASRLVDQALILSRRDKAVSPLSQPPPEEALRTTSAVTGWLSGSILLSLFAAMGGGLLGARGTRRPARPATERG